MASNRNDSVKVSKHFCLLSSDKLEKKTGPVIILTIFKAQYGNETASAYYVSAREKSINGRENANNQLAGFWPWLER